MYKEVIKDRYGMLCALALIPLTGQYGVIVFVLAGLLALTHLLNRHQPVQK